MTLWCSLREKEGCEKGCWGRPGTWGWKIRCGFSETDGDVPEIQRALDIFVQPSLWEGMPLALLKAMGAGLPVVATRVSGCMDAIMDGGNGRLVEPGDAEALARVILELYRHPEERWRLGDAARRTVAERFSCEAMLNRLEGLYLELWRMAIRNNKIGG